MKRVIFGSNYLGQTRTCPECQRQKRLTLRSQPHIGTIYHNGKRDERYTETLTCGHKLDTWIYADGTVRVSLV